METPKSGLHAVSTEGLIKAEKIPVVLGNSRFFRSAASVRARSSQVIRAAALSVTLGQPHPVAQRSPCSDLAGDPM